MQNAGSLLDRVVLPSEGRVVWVLVRLRSGARAAGIDPGRCSRPGRGGRSSSTNMPTDDSRSREKALNETPLADPNPLQNAVEQGSGAIGDLHAAALSAWPGIDSSGDTGQGPLTRGGPCRGAHPRRPSAIPRSAPVDRHAPDAFRQEESSGPNACTAADATAAPRRPNRARAVSMAGMPQPTSQFGGTPRLGSIPPGQHAGAWSRPRPAPSFCRPCP